MTKMNMTFEDYVKGLQHAYEYFFQDSENVDNLFEFKIDLSDTIQLTFETTDLSNPFEFNEYSVIINNDIQYNDKDDLGECLNELFQNYETFEHLKPLKKLCQNYCKKLEKYHEGLIDIDNLNDLQEKIQDTILQNIRLKQIWSEKYSD